MDDILIKPADSIGTIRLGMTQAEVLECIQEYKSKYPMGEGNEYYFDQAFKLEYGPDEKVSGITIDRELRHNLNCMCFGINIFTIRAEEVGLIIDQVAKYDREKAKHGFLYEYPELGLSFWRSNVFTEADMQKEWFLAKRPEEQADDLLYMYFESVRVYCPE
ncbi:hypothetical protein [Paenibacillus taiwanensis]|uniref:hypothetical protein n=1 Tax=Paenibacillus taiwanensis TaxID=401638 RepID=UPI0003FF64AA|nr:hypothetical protein [Paenibacillus taiwanensis]